MLASCPRGCSVRQSRRPLSTYAGRSRSSDQCNRSGRSGTGAVRLVGVTAGGALDLADGPRHRDAGERAAVLERQGLGGRRVGTGRGYEDGRPVVAQLLDALLDVRERAVV